MVELLFLGGVPLACYSRSCYRGVVFRSVYYNPFFRTPGYPLHDLSLSYEVCGKRWKTSTSTRRPTASEVQAALRTLNVTLEMDTASWKGKYHTLVKKYHPDAGGDADHMTRVTVAYDTLIQLTPREKESYASLFHHSTGGSRERKKQCMAQSGRASSTARSGSRGRPSSSTPHSSYSYAFTRRSREADSQSVRRGGSAREGVSDEEEIRQYSSSLYAFVHRRWQQDYFWRSFVRSHSTSMPNEGDGEFKRKKSLFLRYFDFFSYSPITRDSYSSFFVFVPRWDRFWEWRGTRGQKTNDTRRGKYTNNSWYSESNNTSTTRDSKKPFYQGFFGDLKATPYHSFYFGMRPRQRARFLSPTAILARGIIFSLFLLFFFGGVVRFFRDRNQERFHLPAAANVSWQERLYAIHNSDTYPFYLQTTTEEVGDNDYPPLFDHYRSLPSLPPSSASVSSHEYEKSTVKALHNGGLLSVLLSTDSHHDGFSSSFLSRKEMMEVNKTRPKGKQEEHLYNTNKDEGTKGKGDGEMTKLVNNSGSESVTTSSECEDRGWNRLSSRKVKRERMENKGCTMQPSSATVKNTKRTNSSLLRAQNLFRERKIEEEYYRIAVQYGWPTVRTTSCFAREAVAVHSRDVHVDADKELNTIVRQRDSGAKTELEGNMGELPGSFDSFLESPPCLLSSRYGDLSPLYHGYIRGMMIFSPYPQAPSEVLVGDEKLH